MTITTTLVYGAVGSQYSAPVYLVYFTIARRRQFPFQVNRVGRAWIAASKYRDASLCPRLWWFSAADAGFTFPSRDIVYRHIAVYQSQHSAVTVAAPTIVKFCA